MTLTLCVYIYIYQRIYTFNDTCVYKYVKYRGIKINVIHRSKQNICINMTHYTRFDRKIRVTYNMLNNFNSFHSSFQCRIQLDKEKVNQAMTNRKEITQFNSLLYTLTCFSFFLTRISLYGGILSFLYSSNDSNNKLLFTLQI